MKLIISIAMIFCTGLSGALAEDKINFSKARIVSPFSACQNVVIVNENEYKKNSDSWDALAKKCKYSLQFANDIGVTSLDPLSEGLKYFSVAHKVTDKILTNLEKSRKYADCSALCFGGAESCSASLSADNKVVKCAERKEEIKYGMKVYTRKIRKELALATDAPGIVNVNALNILTLGSEKLINSNLRDIDMLTPNPVGRTDLTERELKMAQRTVAYDRKVAEDEYKEKGYTNYNDWMSLRLMKNFEAHTAKYRSLIYEEAPIFSVVDSPKSFDSQGDPVWSDSQIVNAFKKLSKNTDSSKEKVKYSLDNGKLEFNRATAVVKGAVSLVPGTTERNDLLFYMGMANQVEEVLKDDPSMCAAATEMVARMRGKDIQNTTGLIVFNVALPIASKVGGGVFGIGRALSMAEASGLVGLSMGAVTLGNGFNQFNNSKEEAASTSGLGGEKEGTTLRKASEVVASQDAMVTTLQLMPVTMAGSWVVGKVLFSSLSKQMEKDLPALSKLASKAKTSATARDEMVNIWLGDKITRAIKSGLITDAEKEILKTAGSNKVLENLVKNIEKSNPDFFKDPKNLDLFLKTAVANLKKVPGDPSNLGAKAESLMMKLNEEAIKADANPRSHRGVMRLYDNAVEELRVASRKDPATFAKFETDPVAQDTIIRNALKRMGVSSDDIKVMRQCVLRK